MPDNARRLVLGLMPEDATPDDVLAAGPWCFLGVEDRFPDFESTFTFAPEPLRDPCRLDAAEAAAKTLYADILEPLTATCFPEHANLPGAYWETLLAPWAFDVSRQIVERWERIKAMTALWGDLPLTVATLPEDCTFAFADEQSFTLHGAMGLVFNHWLLSRLLLARWPKAWQAETLPKTSWRSPTHPPASALGTLRQKLRDRLLSLPFPRLKGMTMSQALRYSLALLHPSPGEDRSLSIRRTFGSQATGIALDLPFDPMPIYVAALPLSLRNLSHPRRLDGTSAPRTRVANILSYEDTGYRQRLAVWRGRGHRLAYVQHGSNYGQTRTTGLCQAVEYCHHAFVTWGWRRHGKSLGNFIPLPYPRLQRLVGTWKGDGDHVLLVGTEMSAFPYRLDSYPTPLQILDYRRDKARFMEGLPEALRPRVRYRPYFDVPGAFPDGPWLRARFPGVALCTGPITPAMSSCRLLVVDHPGTTILEGLAAGIPMVLFWRPESWFMTPEASDMLDCLRDAGIWYAHPGPAARKVAEVLPDPAAWWNDAAVRKARATYAAMYALTVAGSEDESWLRTLKAL
ncbi:MAG: LIC12162 family protein [Desulfovibrio sp.]|jgi:hypothetical protein|nr:LIC12162 family protein [Desulfovibrio sp.]